MSGHMPQHFMRAPPPYGAPMNNVPLPSYNFRPAGCVASSVYLPDPCMAALYRTPASSVHCCPRNTAPSVGGQPRMIYPQRGPYPSPSFASGKLHYPNTHSSFFQTDLPPVQSVPCTPPPPYSQSGENAVQFNIEPQSSHSEANSYAEFTEQEWCQILRTDTLQSKLNPSSAEFHPKREVLGSFALNSAAQEFRPCPPSINPEMQWVNPKLREKTAFTQEMNVNVGTKRRQSFPSSSASSRSASPVPLSGQRVDHGCQTDIDAIMLDKALCKECKHILGMTDATEKETTPVFRNAQNLTTQQKVKFVARHASVLLREHPELVQTKKMFVARLKVKLQSLCKQFKNNFSELSEWEEGTVCGLAVSLLEEEPILAQEKEAETFLRLLTAEVFSRLEIASDMMDSSESSPVCPSKKVSSSVTHTTPVSAISTSHSSSSALNSASSQRRIPLASLSHLQTDLEERQSTVTSFPDQKTQTCASLSMSSPILVPGYLTSVDPSTDAKMGNMSGGISDKPNSMKVNVAGLQQQEAEKLLQTELKLQQLALANQVLSTAAQEAWQKALKTDVSSKSSPADSTKDDVLPGVTKEGISVPPDLKSIPTPGSANSETSALYTLLGNRPVDDLQISPDLAQFAALQMLYQQQLGISSLKDISEQVSSFPNLMSGSKTDGVATCKVSSKHKHRNEGSTDVSGSESNSGDASTVLHSSAQSKPPKHFPQESDESIPWSSVVISAPSKSEVSLQPALSGLRKLPSCLKTSKKKNSTQLTTTLPLSTKVQIPTFASSQASGHSVDDTGKLHAQSHDALPSSENTLSFPTQQASCAESLVPPGFVVSTAPSGELHQKPRKYLTPLQRTRLKAAAEQAKRHGLPAKDALSNQQKPLSVHSHDARGGSLTHSQNSMTDGMATKEKYASDIKPVSKKMGENHLECLLENDLAQYDVHSVFQSLQEDEQPGCRTPLVARNLRSPDERWALTSEHSLLSVDQTACPFLPSSDPVMSSKTSSVVSMPLTRANSCGNNLPRPPGMFSVVKGEKSPQEVEGMLKYARARNLAVITDPNIACERKMKAALTKVPKEISHETSSLKHSRTQNCSDDFNNPDSFLNSADKPMGSSWYPSDQGMSALTASENLFNNLEKTLEFNEKLGEKFDCSRGRMSSTNTGYDSALCRDENENVKKSMCHPDRLSTMAGNEDNKNVMETGRDSDPQKLGVSVRELTSEVLDSFSLKDVPAEARVEDSFGSDVFSPSKQETVDNACSPVPIDSKYGLDDFLNTARAKERKPKSSEDNVEEEKLLQEQKENNGSHYVAADELGEREWKTVGPKKGKKPAEDTKLVEFRGQEKYRNLTKVIMGVHKHLNKNQAREVLETAFSATSGLVGLRQPAILLEVNSIVKEQYPEDSASELQESLKKDNADSVDEMKSEKKKSSDMPSKDEGDSVPMDKDCSIQ